MVFKTGVSEALARTTGHADLVQLVEQRFELIREGAFGYAVICFTQTAADARLAHHNGVKSRRMHGGLLQTI